MAENTKQNQSVERPKAEDPSKGLLHKPELLDRGLEVHKAQDGVKSSRAQEAEGKWIDAKREELADANRSFGKRHASRI